jgi:threonine dehydrogenase-like Zn-dependent dehydrogenase
MAKNLGCVKTDAARVAMHDLPFPTPGPGQVLLKMRLSTICGSDIDIVDEMPLPTPLGHQATLENAARVTRLGGMLSSVGV